MIVCPDCDVTYEVCWNRHPFYTRIHFCPFCGLEYDERELKKLITDDSEEGRDDA